MAEAQPDPDHERLIQRAAKNQRRWREERDEALVRAIRDGVSVRAAAKAAGLDHSTVLTILKRRGGYERPTDHPR